SEFDRLSWPRVGVLFWPHLLRVLAWCDGLFWPHLLTRRGGYDGLIWPRPHARRGDVRSECGGRRDGEVEDGVVRGDPAGPAQGGRVDPRVGGPVFGSSPHGAGGVSVAGAASAESTGQAGTGTGPGEAVDRRHAARGPAGAAQAAAYREAGAHATVGRARHGGVVFDGAGL